jgi:hypothetical protein
MGGGGFAGLAGGVGEGGIREGVDSEGGTGEGGMEARLAPEGFLVLCSAWIKSCSRSSTLGGGLAASSSRA